VSDNYKPLFETPALFYAVALAIVVAPTPDPIHAIRAQHFSDAASGTRLSTRQSTWFLFVQDFSHCPGSH
jgi:hypothetical protein